MDFERRPGTGHDARPLEAVRAHATVGEMCDALREVGARKCLI
jgi:hypothetical protein